MAIDVKTEPDLSDGAKITEVGAGWWMKYLSDQLYDQDRLRRLDMLAAMTSETPPLPGVPQAAEDAVRDVLALCGTNWGLTIIEAVRNRQLVRGIRSAADDDSTGDGDAWKLWTDMNMPVISADAHRIKAKYGTSYVLTRGPKKDRPDTPIATAEDPRWVVADVEPDRPWMVRAGLKVLHDPVRQVTRAYLYRRGRVDVAESPKGGPEGGARFTPRTWEWVPPTGPLPDPDLMPLEMFEALDGKAEHELHLPLLRRIPFQVLQHLTIAMLQAFKQRVLKGLPAKDDKGNPIDYSEKFPADPASVWIIPGAAEIWESGAIDLTGVLAAVKDSVRELAASSSTPMYMFDAGGENQSAEGAALADAGLVFKVRDRNSRDAIRWVEQIKTSHRWIGKSVEGVSVMWTDPKMISLAEQASAAAQLAAAEMPFRSRWIAVGYDPAEVDRMVVERAGELLQQQIQQQAIADQQAAATIKVEAAKADAAAKAAAANPAPQAQNGVQGAQGAPNGGSGSAGTAKRSTGAQSAA